MSAIHKSMFPPGSLGRALCEQREANARLHPVFQQILAPIMNELSWFTVKDNNPPQDIVVMTKIDDAQGSRNVGPLRLHGRLWFVPDKSIYVYYTPTHWAPMPRTP